MEFCALCGLPESEHPPPPPPGPPDPPPRDRGGVWRPGHGFKASGLTLSEVLDERDGQIDHWRKRAYAAERRLQEVHRLTAEAEGIASEGGSAP